MGFVSCDEIEDYLLALFEFSNIDEFPIAVFKILGHFLHDFGLYSISLVSVLVLDPEHFKVVMQFRTAHESLLHLNRLL